MLVNTKSYWYSLPELKNDLGEEVEKLFIYITDFHYQIFIRETSYMQ